MTGKRETRPSLMVWKGENSEERSLTPAMLFLFLRWRPLLGAGAVACGASLLCDVDAASAWSAFDRRGVLDWAGAAEGAEAGVADVDGTCTAAAAAAAAFFTGVDGADLTMLSQYRLPADMSMKLL